MRRRARCEIEARSPAKSKGEHHLATSKTRLRAERAQLKGALEQQAARSETRLAS